LDYGVLPAAATSKVMIHSAAFPILLVVSALLRGLCGARRPRSFCFALAPFRFWLPRAGPPEKHLLVLGAAPTRFPVPEINGQNKEKRMYLNRITLIGFIGSDAERKAANSTNIAIFSLATKRSWKNDAGSWESRTEWHWCVAFGKLADFAGSLTKGAHIAIEGELRSREYQRDLTVGTQKTTLAQRVWEIRVDSVLKLDRAAKRQGSEENHEEVPL
jgi:single-strand DNA-binding protein